MGEIDNMQLQESRKENGNGQAEKTPENVKLTTKEGRKTNKGHN